MIPVRLELTNFLSYRQKTILDFDGVHLACISGLNGSGKSSLLDAMTWALFGKSRSRSDDDIVNRLAVREGQSAEVRFVFLLEEIPYRIIRQKQQGRSTTLEFQMGVGDDEWRTMNEGGVRQTQAAIEKLLRMNFDTFTNASFFLQGQADEFTTKTPGKRKEILADLLSVNLWDRYREAATARRKEEEEKVLVLDARLQEIEGELEERPTREAELAAAKAELQLANDRLQEKEKLLEQMRRLEAAIEQQKQQVNNLRESLLRAEARLERLQRSQKQREEQRAAFQELLDEAESIEAAYTAWQEAEEELSCWQEKAEAFSQLQQERRPHEIALERERSALEQREKELQRQKTRVSEMRDEKDALEAALDESQKQLAELNEKLDALSEKEEAWHEARAELQRMEGQRQVREQELKRLNAEAQRMERLKHEQDSVQKNLQQASTDLEKAEAEAAGIDQKNERLMQALAERDSLQVQQQRLRESMDKLAERRQKLSEETGGECPLCGQPLTDAHRKAVVDDVVAEGKEQADQFRANRQRLEALEEEIGTLNRAVRERDRLQRDVQNQQQRQATAQARLDEIERALTQWQEEDAPRIAILQEQLADDSAMKEKQIEVAGLGRAVQQKKELESKRNEQQRQASAAEARLAEIRRAMQEWEEEGQNELATVTQRLQNDEYGVEARTAIAAVDARIVALAYDPQAHAASREARKKLAQAPASYQELKQAEAAVIPLDETLADLKQQVAEQEEAVQQFTNQLEAATEQLQTLAQDGGDLRQVEKEVTELREQNVVAQRRVGAARQRLDVLEELEKRRKEEKERRAELTRLIERLQKLEKACGRDGVQALLIEQALPEIEEDANELLERLTGGEMRVSFETQRELKSREELAETLDIRISDVAGERPYENFSGGEQFRVNFAIRLALSRILAKRAGARLQTLVIDEGFGSQDPQGRQRLVEAINVIREDFARVLVITHIDELRDAFPTRIEVEKTPSGSQIIVV